MTVDSTKNKVHRRFVYALEYKFRMRNENAIEICVKMWK